MNKYACIMRAMKRVNAPLNRGHKEKRREHNMKKVTAFLMALTLAIGLTACSGASSSTASGAAESTAASTPAAPSASAAASGSAAGVVGGDPAEHTVEAIKARGKLIVTTEATYPPFEFQDESGNIVGLDAKLAQALADELGVELEIQNIDFNSVVTEVQAGNADMAIAGLSPTPERKESVDMSDLYYGGGQCMLVLAENVDKYATKESLAGQTLATQKGAIQQTLMAEQFADSEALLLPKFPQCIAELKTGACAAVLIDEVSAKQYMETTEGLAIGKVPVETDPAANGNAIAVMKGNTDLLDFVNEKIAAYTEDGSIQTWFDEAQAKASEMGVL